MAEGIQEADAPISGVTVFRDGARVTRTEPLNVQAGLHRTRAAVLPGVVDPASVRVAVRAPAWRCSKSR